jgi:hypothetical protein
MLHLQWCICCDVVRHVASCRIHRSLRHSQSQSQVVLSFRRSIVPLFRRSTILSFYHSVVISFRCSVVLPFCRMSIQLPSNVRPTSIQHPSNFCPTSVSVPFDIRHRSMQNSLSFYAKYVVVSFKVCHCPVQGAMPSVYLVMCIHSFIHHSFQIVRCVRPL